ncbi:MAG: ABC transporter ATP-binding protein [Trueperaceae bacterium]
MHRKGNREVRALVDADLTISPGEYVAIVGPSGSGKSTLLSLLGLLDRPSSGAYELAGKNVASLADRSASAIRNQMIGFVFQNFHLIPHLNAWRNVALPLQYAPAGKAVAPKERRDRAFAALESVGMLEHADHLPRELSGGQEQRVAIARAMVGNPSLILADEPTGNLDSKSRDEVLTLFEQANARGVTIVIITHDLDVAARAHRRVSLGDGRILN